MITYRYINRNQQPTYVSYTLLLEDEDGDEFEETIRIDQVFKVDPRYIDEEFLRSKARIEIAKIMVTLENAKISAVEEVPIGDTGE